ncbi:hypothetical protein DYB37_004304 [Aphanomyces astaci]|uniref:Uncharacterized protein n=1 Tax=Aphanomyces astaci TaxID=112090 RepID=A0A418ELZ3_APHAT|nr:hypothetical protein DYB35_007403 [Aphanomyces astaci]RHZ15589.1 hypothetical protein DYB37_004304 [Aphanomyces astaci]
MDVGLARDALHPTSPRHTFAHRGNIKAQWCDPLYKGPGSELAKPNLHLDLNVLSTTRRTPDTKFPQLTTDDAKQTTDDGKAKLGYFSAKGPTASSHRPTSTAVKFSKLRKGKTNAAQLKRRSSNIFGKSTDTLRKVSRVVGFVARKNATQTSVAISKQYKDVKPVYLDILRPLDDAK